MKTFMMMVFAVAIGALFGFAFGFIVDGSFGWVVAVLMFLFSIDVMHNGTESKDE